MSKASIYETKTENLILPILERMNFELVDVEYVKKEVTGIFVPTLTRRAELQSMIVKLLQEK